MKRVSQVAPAVLKAAARSRAIVGGPATHHAPTQSNTGHRWVGGFSGSGSGGSKKDEKQKKKLVGISARTTPKFAQKRAEEVNLAPPTTKVPNKAEGQKSLKELGPLPPSESRYVYNPYSPHRPKIPSEEEMRAQIAKIEKLYIEDIERQENSYEEFEAEGDEEMLGEEPIEVDLVDVGIEAHEPLPPLPLVWASSKAQQQQKQKGVTPAPRGLKGSASGVPLDNNNKESAKEVNLAPPRRRRRNWDLDAMLADMQSIRREFDENEKRQKRQEAHLKAQRESSKGRLGKQPKDARTKGSNAHQQPKGATPAP